MKRLKIILLVSTILLILSLVFFGSLIFSSEVKMDSGHSKKKIEKQAELSAEETIKKLVNTLYSYDTRDRAFYVGAEQYMTKKAYDKIVPLSDLQEPQEDSTVYMVSQLDEVTCYFHNEDGKVEAMVEVWYKISGTGEFRVRQLLKMTLIKQEGWKIDSCDVMDTMEE